MITLEDYIKSKYPEKVEEYIRYVTPSYYEPGIIYKTLVRGFGEGIPGIKSFIIESGTYLDDDIQLTLSEVGNPSHKCGVNLSEAHLKIKRETEETPKGLLIPNNKSRLRVSCNNRNYTVYQFYWRNYNSPFEKCGRIIVTCDQDEPINRRFPYYELYSHFSSKWHLKHVKSYDGVQREIYDIKFNISIRDFKQYVFGDSNIKFKHEELQELSDKVERAIRSSGMSVSI